MRKGDLRYQGPDREALTPSLENLNYYLAGQMTSKGNKFF
jgi:hypothetical protein